MHWLIYIVFCASCSDGLVSRAMKQWEEAAPTVPRFFPDELGAVSSCMKIAKETSADSRKSVLAALQFAPDTAVEVLPSHCATCGNPYDPPRPAVTRARVSTGSGAPGLESPSNSRVDGMSTPPIPEQDPKQDACDPTLPEASASASTSTIGTGGDDDALSPIQLPKYTVLKHRCRTTQCQYADEKERARDSLCKADKQFRKNTTRVGVQVGYVLMRWILDDTVDVIVPASEPGSAERTVHKRLPRWRVRLIHQTKQVQAKLHAQEEAPFVADTKVRHVTVFLDHRYTCVCGDRNQVICPMQSPQLVGWLQDDTHSHLETNVATVTLHCCVVVIVVIVVIVVVVAVIAVVVCAFRSWMTVGVDSAHGGENWRPQLHRRRLRFCGENWRPHLRHRRLRMQPCWRTPDESRGPGPVLQQLLGKTLKWTRNDVTFATRY